MKEKDIILKVPNDLKYIPLVVSTAGQLAGLMGFEEKEKREIELGTEEAVSGIIKNAFEEGQDASVDLIFKQQALGLEIVLKEKGIPFDPDIITEFSPDKFLEDLSDEGLGIYLMKKFMDKYSFINLGKEGKETHLFKYLGQNKIDVLLSEEEARQAEKERAAQPMPKGSVKYTVRSSKPDEAVEISKLAYSCYGYTYVHEDIYFPDRVRELNRKEDLLSFIAVTDNNEIIAHAGLEREHDRNVPQLGVAVTKPKFRGQGCLGALNEIMFEEAEIRKFYGVYARGICTHIFSQKSISKVGMRSTALLVSSGREREYKNIEQGKIQRESVVLMFIPLLIPDDLVFYPPAGHYEMIRKIYDTLGMKVELKKDGGVHELPQTAASVEVQTSMESLTADILVHEAGMDVFQEVAAQMANLKQDGIATIYLQLRLSDKCTPILSEGFEATGFFFAGLQPHSDYGDVLILQYLFNQVMDYDIIHVAEEIAHELKTYIKERDPAQQLNQ